MEPNSQIRSDFKAVLAEHHTLFEFLNTYKGVPVICRAALKKVTDQGVVFQVRMPEAAALEKAKTTQILSDGLLEPIEARAVSFDPETGTVVLGKFAYSGSKILNRKEMRVEPAERMEVKVECDQKSCVGVLRDISMRGIGVQIAPKDGSQFSQNKAIDLTLQLAGSEIKMPGRVRNLNQSGDQLRLAVEFTGPSPEKSLVARYILNRRSEIFYELREIYAPLELSK